MRTGGLLIGIVLLHVGLLGCRAPYHVSSKGYFIEGTNYPRQGSYFATDLPVEPNDLPKLYQGSDHYFVWRLIRYNYVEQDDVFATYRTLQQGELASLSPEEKKYVMTEENQLNNYLFFIDDRRFIYLSEDDWRNRRSLGTVPMYFDNAHYKPDRWRESGMKQMLRGYYTLKGDRLFLDFEGETHFYIWATVSNNHTVEFDSVSTPARDLLYREGLNIDFNPFGMFNEKAQPIFERPDRTDALVDYQFELSFGFAGRDVAPEKRNSLHVRLSLPACAQKAVITKIHYDTRDSLRPKRVYDYIYRGDGACHGQDRAEENLCAGWGDECVDDGDPDRWYDIETW